MSTPRTYLRSIRIGGGYVTLALENYDPLHAPPDERAFIERLVAKFDEGRRPEPTTEDGAR